MKKFLPAFFTNKFFSAIIIVFALYFFNIHGSLYAQTSIATPTPTPAIIPTATPTPIVSLPSPTPAGSQNAGGIDQNDGNWVPDSEVTFAGKLASRSALFLDFALSHPQWYFLDSDASSSSLSFAWVAVRNIMYAFFALVVLISAFILIVSRGRNITVMQFIPRFIGMILLVTFSFAILQFLYQITDILQGFFLKKNGSALSISDVIKITLDYKNFVGYRLTGQPYDESSFISLFLVRFTTITAYLMAGVLYLRKIVLWLFIIVSPVFPFLLLYKPIRNTGKIWVGEFFRWLLYAPLFSILLAGVVALWDTNIFKPIVGAADSIYPTSVNILLGAPSQDVSVINSINMPGTFLLYAFSLIMLWSTIILPFVLLQIFLDYFYGFSFQENPLYKRFLNLGFPQAPKPPLPPHSPLSPVPPSLQPTGVARALPFSFSQPSIRNSSIAGSTQVFNTSHVSSRETTQNMRLRSVQSSTPILQMTNLSVPTIRDIAEYDTAAITKSSSKNNEIASVHQSLQKIAAPTMAAIPTEQAHFQSVKQQLTVEKQKGNPMATAILSAAATVSAAPLTASQTTSMFPVINRVQSVNLDDYEAVKKLWQENYQKLEPPKNMEGIQKDRKQWVQEDMQSITDTINLLLSQDPKKVKEGMSMVGKILPFLLIGGFSQTEVIAYLKAKLEAARSTVTELSKKQEEEETQVERSEKTRSASSGQEEKHMEESIAIDPDNGKETNIQGNDYNK